MGQREYTTNDASDFCKASRATVVEVLAVVPVGGREVNRPTRKRSAARGK